MSQMFYGCSSLKELNLNNFNTNNVINMSCMSCGCSSLKELNFNNFNTNNVTNMGVMFYDCSSLKALNFNNFNTNNVTYMRDMFYVCVWIGPHIFSELIRINFFKRALTTSFFNVPSSLSCFSQ